MKGLKINTVVERDEMKPDGQIIPAFYEKAEDIPEDSKSLYKKINCDDKRAEKAQGTDRIDIWARLDVRNVVVIKGIPFYSSTGTSPDGSVISPGWRKNVWMPFMGFQAHGRSAGTIEKLGSSKAKIFNHFITKLIADWSKENTQTEEQAKKFDEQLKLLYKKNNRSSYERGQVANNTNPGTHTALGSIIDQLTSRFGSIDAFAYSMQLLPDDAWTDKQPGDYEEDFSILRSLRDYFLKHYQYPEISEELESDVKNASFEEWNEDYGHVLETNNGKPQLGNRKISRIKDNVRKEQLSEQHSEFYSDLNHQLLEMGADTTYLAQLRNPSASMSNTMTSQLSDLILNLNPQDKNTAQSVWEDHIDNIIDKLMPLEQDKNLDEQKNKYNNLFDNFFEFRQNLGKNKPIEDIPHLLSSSLNSIETLDDSFKQKLSETILYTACTSKLQQLTEDCLQHVGEKKPAHAVLKGLQNILNENNLTAKEKTDNFFAHLSADDHNNLEVLKKDNSRSTKQFLQGIAVIAAIVCTGILPGLAIAGIAYAASKGSAFDFFKPKTTELTENLEQIEQSTLKK